MNMPVTSINMWCVRGNENLFLWFFNLMIIREIHLLWRCTTLILLFACNASQCANTSSSIYIELESSLTSANNYSLSGLSSYKYHKVEVFLFSMNHLGLHQILPLLIYPTRLFSLLFDAWIFALLERHLLLSFHIVTRCSWTCNSEISSAIVRVVKSQDSSIAAIFYSNLSGRLTEIFSTTFWSGKFSPSILIWFTISISLEEYNSLQS